MGLASSLKAYFFGFMPVQLIVAMVEGAMYGGWRLSASDLMDQLSGRLVFAAPWLGPRALFVVPLFVIAFRFVNSKVDVKRQRLSALILGPLSVAGGSTITSLLLGGLGIVGWIDLGDPIHTCLVPVRMAHCWHGLWLPKYPTRRDAVTKR